MLAVIDTIITSHQIGDNEGEDCILQKNCNLLCAVAGNVTAAECSSIQLPHNLITGSHY